MSDLFSNGDLVKVNTISKKGIGVIVGQNIPKVKISVKVDDDFFSEVIDILPFYKVFIDGGVSLYPDIALEKIVDVRKLEENKRK